MLWRRDTVNKRSIIYGVLAMLVLAGAMALVSVGVAALRPSDRAHANAQIELPISSLQEGVPLTVQVNNIPLILLRPTQAQKEAIAHLDAHVWDSSLSAWKAEIEAFAYWGWETQFGCDLRYVPPGESIRVKYNPQSDAKWLGGYVGDRCGNAAYDLAGRTIKDEQLSYNGYTGRQPNLESPVIRRSGERFFVSLNRR